MQMRNNGSNSREAKMNLCVLVALTPVRPDGAAGTSSR